jgi:hypothetical protein
MSDSPLFTSSLLDVPRPFIDVVSTSIEALGVGALIFERPRRPSTTVVVLDHMRRGIHLNRFAPLGPVTIHDIIADCSELHHADGVVLLSSRTTSHSIVHDLHILHVARAMLHNAGLELLDWIVTSPGEIYRPESWSSTPDSWVPGSPCI